MMCTKILSYLFLPGLPLQGLVATWVQDRKTWQRRHCWGQMNNSSLGFESTEKGIHRFTAGLNDFMNDHGYGEKILFTFK